MFEVADVLLDPIPFVPKEMDLPILNTSIEVCLCPQLGNFWTLISKSRFSGRSYANYGKTILVTLSRW